MASKRKKLNRYLVDAVMMRDTAKARELLEQGADVNARDSEHDETPLIVAAKSDDATTLRVLLYAAADLEARDDQGRTALFFASVSSEVFEALVEAGANIHAKDAEGNTILMRKVSECPSLGEVEKLMGFGVDPGARNEDGQTALDVAEGLGLVKVVERLRAATAV